MSLTLHTFVRYFRRNCKTLDIEADEDDDNGDFTYDYSDDLYFQEDYRRLIEKLAARFNHPLPAAWRVEQNEDIAHDDDNSCRLLT